MLTALDRYLLRKLVAAFGPAIGGIALLLFVGGTFRLLQEESLSLAQIAVALPWLLPYLLPFIIPLAWLITLSLVYGRLVADREVIAFSCLGISWRTLARPAVLLGLLLSVASLVSSTTLVPYSHQKRKEAVAAVLLQLADLGEGQHLSRVFDSQGLDIYVREYGPGELRGIVLNKAVFPSRESDESSRQLYHLVAERGALSVDEGSEALILELDDVVVTVRRGSDPAEPPVRLHLERFVQRVGVGGWWRTKEKDYTTPHLRRLIEAHREAHALAAAAGGVTGASQSQSLYVLEARIEIAMRAALALAPLLLTLLVVPLTVLLQARSALVPFFWSLAGGSLLFFAPTLAGASLAETTAWPPSAFLGCATGVLGAAGLGWLAGRTY